jgi:hypothetical protein
MSRLPNLAALAIPINNMFFRKMLDVLTAENQQLRSNGDLHFGEYIEDNTGMSNSLINS